MNSDVPQLLPSLLRHEAADVRLAAAWTATNLAYDAHGTDSPRSPVSPAHASAALGVPNKTKCCT